MAAVKPTALPSLHSWRVVGPSNSLHSLTIVVQGSDRRVLLSSRRGHFKQGGHNLGMQPHGPRCQQPSKTPCLLVTLT